MAEQIDAQAGKTVLLTARGIDPATIDQLRRAGLQVRHPALEDTDPPPETLPTLLDGVAGWILGGTNVDRALLIQHPALAIIARRGVGYEQIDHVAAGDLGRVVTICAGGNGPSVADHTIGLILAVSKRLVEFTINLRRGDWSYGIGVELYRKTVGIIGLGRIGRGVAERLAGFGVRVLAYEVAPDERYARSHGISLVGLPDLLAEADIVTVHAPLTTATRHMFDAGTLGQMKPGVIFINTARGGLVNEADLLAALNSGHVAGAGLDVFEAEKDPGQNALAMALASHSRVVATPHTAASTVEGLARTNMIAAENVISVLNGGDPLPDCTVADGRSRAG